MPFVLYTSMSRQEQEQCRLDILIRVQDWGAEGRPAWHPGDPAVSAVPGAAGNI